MPYYGFYFDPTYILVVIGAVICMAASAKVKVTFCKYNKVRSMAGLTGKQAAERILHTAGIYDVEVVHIPGNLNDHYDPRNKVLGLSDSTFHSASVAALGVAAHECGHAIQHQESYVPLSIRSALVPLVNFGSSAAWPLIIIGFFITSGAGQFLINLGIFCFFGAVLFQLITLPVEFNASRRAVRILGETGILREEEIKGTKKVLGAAALTYVAGAASSILQFLRMVLLYGRKNED